MSYSKASDAAFPRGEPSDEAGMSMREWYAGMALVGYLAMHADTATKGPDFTRAAKFAFDYADAMLAQAAKELPCQK